MAPAVCTASVIARYRGTIAQAVSNDSDPVFALP